MTDVPVYMMVNLHITHPDTYRQYEKGFFPLLKKYGGEFIIFDETALVMTLSLHRQTTKLYSL